MEPPGPKPPTLPKPSTLPKHPTPPTLSPRLKPSLESEPEHSSKGVYIPLCGTKHCSQWLEKLRVELAKYVTCKAEHPINGNYKCWFKDYFEECVFTIVHYCPFLWKKIHTFNEYFQEQHRKFILLKVPCLENETTTYGDESIATSLQAFFEEMDSEQKIDNHNDLSVFIRKVLLALNPEIAKKFDEDFDEYQASGSIISNRSSTNYESTVYYSTSSETYNVNMTGSEGHEEHNKIFDKYCDLFGSGENTNVFVRSFDAQRSPSKPFQYITPNDLVDQINAFPRDNFQDRNYILHKLLPTLYQDKKIFELSYITKCNWLILKERALVLLEFIFWESWADDGIYSGQFEVILLIDICRPLLDTFNSLKEEYKKSNKHKVLNLLKHMIHVLVMLFSTMIMSPTKSKQATLAVINFLKEKRNAFKKSQELSDISEETLRSFLELTNGEDYCNRWDTANTFLEHFDNHPSKCTPKKLMEENLCVQFIVISGLMKKVFCLNKDPLKFLSDYLKPARSLKNLWRKKRVPCGACVTMVFRGLSLFLSYGTRTKEHMDVRKLCEEAMGVIKVAAERDLSNEIGRSLLSLLFDSRYFIRRIIIDIFKKRQSYRENLLTYSMNAIEQLLIPFVWKITTVSQNKKDIISTQSLEWNVVNIQYAERPAQMYIIVISEKDHYEVNKTRFKEQMNMNYSEIMALTKLKHENIIEMFAFQTAKMPQFYILEDGREKLQVMLKNAQDNQKFFKSDFLCKLLLDAVKGLQYCHDQSYIHRNLTADSLCVVNMSTVKLCSFGLCTQHSKNGIAIELDSKTIPLRWSAPESICKGEFSKQSDIWMFGHLIYEVLTHGLLPYSTFLPSDNDFMEALMSGTLSLQNEQCLGDHVFELITKCAGNNSKDRPSVEAVYSLMKEWGPCDSHQEKMNYPVIDGDNGSSSTVVTRGIPSTYCGKKSQASGTARRGSLLAESAQIDMRDDITYDVQVFQPMSLDTKASLHCKELHDLLPPIELYRSADGVESLKCKIPHQARNLYDITLNRLLGNNLTSYLSLLYKVAENLFQLHSRSWVIGDLSPSCVFVDKSKLKPYIASLSCLKYVGQQRQSSSENKETDVKLPADRQSSAAPEVIKQSQFSTATDVFCFGNFLWVLLMAYEGSTYDEEIKPFGNMPQKKAYQALMTGKWQEINPKPSMCPDELYELIVRCVSVKEKERPIMEKILECLKRYCQVEVMLHEDNPSEVSAGSLRMRKHKYLGMSKPWRFFTSNHTRARQQSFLEENNPSILSEDEAVPASPLPEAQIYGECPEDSLYGTDENPYECIVDYDDGSRSSFQQFSASALTFAYDSSFTSLESIEINDTIAVYKDNEEVYMNNGVPPPLPKRKD